MTHKLQSHDTKNCDKYKKSWQIKFKVCSSLSISSHLPAPFLNGEGDRIWKFQICKNFKLPRSRNLDLDWLTSWHTIIDLYLLAKFHSNCKTTCCGYMDRPTSRLALLGRQTTRIQTTPCPEKKGTNSILGVTSSNTGQFSKFFQCHNLL